MVISEYVICIDIIAIFAGVCGYTFVTLHTWNVIYSTDMIYNNVTRVDNGVVFDGEKQLYVSSIIMYYGTGILISIVWLWCSINKLCYRYYLLFVSYIWYTCIFCTLLLNYSCRCDEVANDDYIQSYLITCIIAIPSVLCCIFTIRHCVYYATYNDNYDMYNRYPKYSYNIVAAIMYDMYEFFIIPIVNVLFMLLMVLAMCVICDSGDSNFTDTSSICESTGGVHQKNIGFISLETTYTNPEEKFNMMMI